MRDVYRRHQRAWRVLHAVMRGFITRKYHLTHEDITVDGPMLLVPNHVSEWDPLLVAMSLKNKQVYYVASEHLFRKGALSKLLVWLLGPIPRSKAAAGTDTVRACLRHLKEGHSVCLFAEGEQSWDGRNHTVSPSAGKLAKISGATLVTYRLEGAYLSKPRWADTSRRGRVHGHPVGIYPPAVLKTMSAEAIADVINRDIRENAWERQAENPIPYNGKRLAEGLERLLYLCPSCRRIGTLTSRDDTLSCSCGLKVRYRADGFLAPGTPFATIADWEDRQRQALLDGDYIHGESLFSDDRVTLTKLEAGHRQTVLYQGTLTQYSDRLTCGSYIFPLARISSMAMTRTHILLFSEGDAYYQLSASIGINFRKYLGIWESQHPGIS